MIHTLSPSSTPGPRKDFALVRFALSKLALKTSFTPTLHEKNVLKSANHFLLHSVSDMTIDLYAPIRHMLYLTTHLENVLFGLNNIRTCHQKEGVGTLRSQGNRVRFIHSVST